MVSSKFGILNFDLFNWTHFHKVQNWNHFEVDFEYIRQLAIRYVYRQCERQ